MNSEELEQSLRIEFESYLKEISAGMRQEIVEFQQKIEAEAERHKSQLAEVFEDFSARSEKDAELGAGFRDSVVEHLRLARDEGARITATAFAEAEEMAKETAAAEAEAAAAVVPSAGITKLRDAINDISSQTSQAAILKTLVLHAGQFTPRGAFFIIKNEHFVGWRVFGKEVEEQPEIEAAVREVFFPLSAETTLGESVKSLNAVESSFGTHVDDAGFLEKLKFGEPEKMFAVPLVARGRGVAVLYADYGTQGEEANVEALETLVRVAGLTVEVIAAAGGAAKPAATSWRQTQKSATETADFSRQQDEADSPENSQPAESGQSDEPQTFAETDYSADAELNQTAGQFDYQYPTQSDNLSAAPRDFQPETADGESETVSDEYTPQEFSADDYAVEEVEAVSDAPVIESEEFQPVYQTEQTESPESYSWNQPAAETSEEDFSQSYQPQTEVQDETETYQPNVEAENDYSAPASTNEFQFDASQPFEPTQNQFEDAPPSFDSSQFDGAAFESAQGYSPAKEEIGDSFQTQNGAAATDESFNFKPTAETVAEPAAASTKPVRSRFSDKNVDLPIEVSEDERRLHNDARRFARLLVSEIKLYNEQKVKEGRDGSDLYERLREAIDRSREMYDKRIQPPVAAKFDYFHYELVNTLADGSEAKLGADYPGAAV